MSFGGRAQQYHSRSLLNPNPIWISISIRHSSSEEEYLMEMPKQMRIILNKDDLVFTTMKKYILVLLQ
jgi:hypothetical protein